MTACAPDHDNARAWAASALPAAPAASVCDTYRSPVATRIALIMHTSTASMMKERRADERDRSPLIRRLLLPAIGNDDDTPAIWRRRSKRFRLAQRSEFTLVEVRARFGGLR